MDSDKETCWFNQKYKKITFVFKQVCQEQCMNNKMANRKLMNKSMINLVKCRKFVQNVTIAQHAIIHLFQRKKI